MILNARKPTKPMEESKIYLKVYTFVSQAFDLHIDATAASSKVTGGICSFVWFLTIVLAAP